MLIQGFPIDSTIHEIRNVLRDKLKNSSLQQSIDARYTLQTAHSTVTRFKKGLQNTERFLTVLEKYRDFDFGTFEVKEVELVFNDWYMRESVVKQLHVFPLA